MSHFRPANPDMAYPDGRFSTPSPTTMSPYIEQIARLAVDLLAEKLSASVASQHRWS